MIDTNGSPLSNPAFRRVWVGATVSAAGDAASWVALVAYALGPAHGSVATLAVLYTAPVAVGGLVAGWALDRYDRRRLLIADSLARAAVFATLPLAAAWGGLSDVQTYLVAAVYGLLKMTSLAGFPALIPELVPPGQLMAANALESVSFGIAASIAAAGDLPVPPATARAVRALAERLAGGELTLDEGADRIATRRVLLAVPGLGPTRVEDIMLHALGDPDAFPTANVRTAAVAHGLPAGTLAERAERWRPWRAYAAHLLWRTAPLRG